MAKVAVIFLALAVASGVLIFSNVSGRSHVVLDILFVVCVVCLMAALTVVVAQRAAAALRRDAREQSGGAKGCLPGPPPPGTPGASIQMQPERDGEGPGR